MVDNYKEGEVSVILTVYKRNYIDEQIRAILAQTVIPYKIYLWQNEEHIDVTEYREKYGVSLIRADENFKFHGRFAFANLMQTEYVAIFDDDIIPGKKWLENCLRLSRERNCIVGANGRTFIRDSEWTGYESLVREDSKSHLVGHCWFFRKEWLKYMWMLEPYTYENGEDIHFCLSARLFGEIESFVAKQTTLDEMADITKNKYSTDEYASFLKADHKPIRDKIIHYFRRNGWNLQM
jgi:hypothetical protein